MNNQLDDLVSEPTIRKVLFFDDMLTPKLIQVAYWLGLVAVVWNGLGRLFSGGFFGIFEAVVFVLISAILLRVAAELVMLLFKLHDTMQAIAANTQPPSPTETEVKQEASAEVMASAEAKPPVKTVRKTKKKLSKKVSKKPGS